jgi:ankyrin repeat protein
MPVIQPHLHLYLVTDQCIRPIPILQIISRVYSTLDYFLTSRTRSLIWHLHPFGSTVLHISAAHGYEDLAGTLLQRGANPDVFFYSSGCVALHYAAGSGHLNVVATLLDAGANATPVNIHGLTAMHLAAEKGFEHIVLLLIDAGLDVDFRSGLDFT